MSLKPVSAPNRFRRGGQDRLVVEATYLAADTCRAMAKKPEPPKPLTWDIFKAAAKLRPLGTIEAVDEAAAIEKAAEQFKVIASKLIAVPRR